MSSRPQTSGSQQNSPRVPSFLGRQQHRSSPSSPRNILDRLIPCRSEMNMLLAQHLLSPMSHHYDSEQQDNPRQSMPILKFSNKVVKAKPMTPLSCGMTPKSKFKIPTSPHRVMAAPGTFLHCGNQSTHWAPSDNFVVALKDGVYVYVDCEVIEIWNNDVRDPFRHVIWNSTGDSIICGSGGGEIQIYDLNTPDPKIKWRLLKESGIYTMALGQHHLLTCAAWPGKFDGVGVYDLRQTGGSTKPILSLHQNLAAYSLSWSTNGYLLAVGCGYATYLWDVRNPSKAMNIFRNPGDEYDENPFMNWCPWNPNVLFACTGYPESSIRLHNATTGELIDAFECASEVSGIQFNVELEQVATSHNDYSREDATRHIHGEEGTVQFWEFNTSNKLNPIQKISYRKEGIISMAASANSSQLLTLGGDEKLCLWNWKNRTALHSNKNSEAGFQTTRSQLDTFNLIR